MSATERNRTPRSVAIAPDPPAEWATKAADAAGARIVPVADADGIIWASFGGTGLPETLAAAPRAQWVQLASAGIEWLFDEDVYRADIVWTCGKGVFGQRVAELALGLIICARRGIFRYVGATSWSPVPGDSLASAHVGILGAGGIGRSLLELLRPLGPRVTFLTASGKPVPGGGRTVRVDQLQGLAPEFDVLVVAAPLTPATRHIVDAALLAAMKSSAWIVNVARGQLVDTDALVAALAQDEIGGAALDVTDPEPLPDGHPLWGFANCIVTPHVANSTAGAIEALQRRVTENIERFLAGGELLGIVDAGARY